MSQPYVRGPGEVRDTVLAFVIGASLMILAGLVEIVLGVRAERRGLEGIAQALTTYPPYPRASENSNAISMHMLPSAIGMAGHSDCHAPIGQPRRRAMAR